MNKTISINPDLFTVTSNKRTSRKKQQKGNDIKVKSSQKLKEKQKKYHKRSILNLLRKKQNENYNKLMNYNESKPVPPIDTTFNSDFEESLKYFNELSKQPTKQNFTPKIHDTSHISYNDPDLASLPETNISLVDNSHLHLSEPKIQNVPSPVWGCLKNGDLPTFRDWKRSTQKVPYLEKMNEKKNEIRQMMEKNLNKNEPKLKYIKQKKTVRRKYKVGRPNNFSKVGVLISNKTVRNNIMNKSQQFKQIPIEEIKRYLIKRGFIRVGTSAPNDVLRKMYETSNLVCGELENHNADNLLFNYLNDVE